MTLRAYLILSTEGETDLEASETLALAIAAHTEAAVKAAVQIKNAEMAEVLMAGQEDVRIAVKEYQAWGQGMIDKFADFTARLASSEKVQREHMDLCVEAQVKNTRERLILEDRLASAHHDHETALALRDAMRTERDILETERDEWKANYDGLYTDHMALLKLVSALKQEIRAGREG